MASKSVDFSNTCISLEDLWCIITSPPSRCLPSTRGDLQGLYHAQPGLSTSVEAFEERSQTQQTSQFVANREEDASTFAPAFATLSDSECRPHSGRKVEKFNLFKDKEDPFATTLAEVRSSNRNNASCQITVTTTSYVTSTGNDPLFEIASAKKSNSAPPNTAPLNTRNEEKGSNAPANKSKIPHNFECNDNKMSEKQEETHEEDELETVRYYRNGENFRKMEFLLRVKLADAIRAANENGNFELLSLKLVSLLAEAMKAPSINFEAASAVTPPLTTPPNTEFNKKSNDSSTTTAGNTNHQSSAAKVPRRRGQNKTRIGKIMTDECSPLKQAEVDGNGLELFLTPFPPSAASSSSSFPQIGSSLGGILSATKSYLAQQTSQQGNSSSSKTIQKRSASYQVCCYDQHRRLMKHKCMNRPKSTQTTAREQPIVTFHPLLELSSCSRRAWDNERNDNTTSPVTPLSLNRSGNEEEDKKGFYDTPLDGNRKTFGRTKDDIAKRCTCACTSLDVSDLSLNSQKEAEKEFEEHQERNDRHISEALNSQYQSSHSRIRCSPPQSRAPNNQTPIGKSTSGSCSFPPHHGRSSVASAGGKSSMAIRRERLPLRLMPTIKNYERRARASIANFHFPPLEDEGLKDNSEINEVIIKHKQNTNVWYTDSNNSNDTLFAPPWPWLRQRSKIRGSNAVSSQNNCGSSEYNEGEVCNVNRLSLSPPCSVYGGPEATNSHSPFPSCSPNKNDDNLCPLPSSHSYNTSVCEECAPSSLPAPTIILFQNPGEEIDRYRPEVAFCVSNVANLSRSPLRSATSISTTASSPTSKKTSFDHGSGHTQHSREELIKECARQRHRRRSASELTAFTFCVHSGSENNNISNSRKCFFSETSSSPLCRCESHSGLKEMKNKPFDETLAYSAVGSSLSLATKSNSVAQNETKIGCAEPSVCVVRGIEVVFSSHLGSGTSSCENSSIGVMSPKHLSSHVFATGATSVVDEPGFSRLAIDADAREEHSVHTVPVGAVDNKEQEASVSPKELPLFELISSKAKVTSSSQRLPPKKVSSLLQSLFSASTDTKNRSLTPATQTGIESFSSHIMHIGHFQPPAQEHIEEKVGQKDDDKEARGRHGSIRRAEHEGSSPLDDYHLRLRTSSTTTYTTKSPLLHSTASFGPTPATVVTTRATRKAEDEGNDDGAFGDGYWLLNDYVLLCEVGRGRYGTVMVAYNLLSSPNEEEQEGTAAAAAAAPMKAIKIVPRVTMARNRLLRAARSPSTEHTNASTADVCGTATTMTTTDKAPERPECAEVEAMRRLRRHPNILPLEEVIDDPCDANLYLVMPFIERGPVVKLDVRGRCEPVASALLTLYMRQLLSAVAHMHRHGVAHCDIKPDNILLGDDGQLFLADFGACEIFDRGAGDGHAPPRPPFATRKIKGTLAFTAPEALSGAHYDASKADVWAVGVCLYAFLFGRLPFAAGIYEPQTINSTSISNQSATSSPSSLVQGTSPSITVRRAFSMIQRASFDTSKLREEANDEALYNAERREMPRALEDYLGVETNSGRASLSLIGGEESDPTDSGNIQTHGAQSATAFDHVTSSKAISKSPEGYSTAIIIARRRRRRSSAMRLVACNQKDLALDLLARLLTKDPSKRPSAEEALQHPLCYPVFSL